MKIQDLGIIEGILKNLNKASRPFLSLPRYAKRIIVLLVDVSQCVLTVWLAFYLRLGEFVTLSGSAFWAVGISVLIALPIFVVSGLYHAIFRYSGASAMFALARAIGVYGLLYVSAITAIGISGIPRTVGLIQPLLLFFAIGSTRLLARYWLGGIYQSQLHISSLPRALVYGAGSAGRQLVSALEKSFEMRVVGFLDDDDRLYGHVLNGQPIFSTDDLGDLIASKGITHILLAIPSASRSRRNQIFEKIGRYGVTVRTLPSMTDLAEGRVTISDLRDLEIDDLLGREPVMPNHILLAKNISSRVVLVTGAGGSIGSELCRQILALSPAKLLMVDHSEIALYNIDQELEVKISAHKGARSTILVPLIASVQDEDRMREIMSTWRPDTVYHAAAYKHVPLVEYNCAAGLNNNLMGTLHTAQAAAEYGVTDFVLISTDKAVRPTNVMGASKRLAEMALQALADIRSDTKFSIVRFGNVLGSSGSVVPKFREQIRTGGQITLTHPDVMRYFMTPPEAAQLVIQAGAMAKGGDVFVLNMGEQVKIIDLARRMVELSGLTLKDEVHPDGDIEILVTGLRPGEKLYEELLLGENPTATLHPSIMKAHEKFIPWEEFEPKLHALKVALSANEIGVIRLMMQQLVDGYVPSNDILDWIHLQQKVTAADITDS